MDKTEIEDGFKRIDMTVVLFLSKEILINHVVYRKGTLSITYDGRFLILAA